MQELNGADSAAQGHRSSGDDTLKWIELVAVKRDKQAFANLYGVFAAKVKTYMRRQGADEASAEDLAQETMVQVWRKAGQYDPRRAAPATWIFRIARNLQIDKLRRQKFHEVEFTREAERVDETVAGHERSTESPDADRLGRLVDSLPADQLTVVRLAFFEGLSHGEISERLSIPLGTVKSRLRLAFAKLRMTMES
jgi:RNA polymerase sigma-70 factor (ECF subfamily)